tara:strand:+ start:2010 stop:2369 length:360 start_codon:yes stop_codon:yes gene_type:complete
VNESTKAKKNKQETLFNDNMQEIQERCRSIVYLVKASSPAETAYSKSVSEVFISLQAFIVNFKSALESSNPYFFDLAKHKIADLCGAVYNSHINCPPKNQQKPKVEPKDEPEQEQKHAS